MLTKRFAIVIALALLAALWGVSSPMEAQGQIKQLTIGIGIDADTLNPQEQTTVLIMNMCALLYDTFLYQTPEGKLEPHLVTEYEVSPDGLTRTLHLRKGVKFSDGTPFNANAVKLSFDRTLDQKLRVPLRYVFTAVNECVVVDDSTVQLKLKYPYAPMEQTLSTVVAATISPAAIEKYGDDVRNHPVGAGPFKLSEWVKGNRIVMVRNDDYWGPKATVEKIIWKIVPDPLTREVMLRTGLIDICYKPPPPDVAALKADAKIKVDMPLDTRTMFIALRGDRPALKDKRVRQAFNYAVDKKGIVKRILFDDAQPMDGPVSPMLFGYAKMEPQYDYNADKAKQLLKEANFDFNQTIRLATPQGRYLFDMQVAEAVQAYLQAIGVKVELRVYDWPMYVAAVYKVEQPEMDVCLLGWGPVIMDADLALYGQFHTSVIPPKGLGSAFYSSPEFDKAIEAARIEQDPNKRLELFKKAGEIVWCDCPWIWLYVEKFVIAYSSKIQNMAVTPTEMFYPTYIAMK
jgi:ABC-type transport system substrate-binding protein